jgi:hypothetical protein
MSEVYIAMLNDVPELEVPQLTSTTVDETALAIPMR